MKKLLFILALTAMCVVSCKNDKDDEPSGSTDPSEVTVEPSDEPQRGTFALGADISWLSEMEADGKTFKNEEGTQTECMELLKSIGCNSVRLRVWVDPYGGWSGKEDVVKLAKRATALKLRVMIDFHYSDFFCDPSRQTKPYAWKDLDLDGLTTKVAEHTLDVCQALKAAGVEPEWVQVGNETRNGMLWDEGRFWNSSGRIENCYKHFAQLSNAGYDAIKQVFPDASVILHVNHAYDDNSWWYTEIKNAGGKFDIIGLSHYPQSDNSSKTYEELNTAAVSQIKSLITKFAKPVMLVEFGTKSNSENLALTVVQDFKTKIAAANLTKYAGIFYWEPEVYGYWKPDVYSSTDTEWNRYHVGSSTMGWNSYDMGAFTSAGKPNKALIELYKQ